MTPTSVKKRPFTQPLRSPSNPHPPSSQLYPDGTLASPSSSLSFSSVFNRGIVAGMYMHLYPAEQIFLQYFFSSSC